MKRDQLPPLAKRMWERATTKAVVAVLASAWMWPADRKREMEREGKSSIAVRMRAKLTPIRLVQQCRHVSLILYVNFSFFIARWETTPGPSVSRHPCRGADRVSLIGVSRLTTLHQIEFITSTLCVLMRAHHHRAPFLALSVSSAPSVPFRSVREPTVATLLQRSRN